MRRWVFEPATWTSIEPPVPAGMIVALAMVTPAAVKLRTEVTCAGGFPVGQARMSPPPAVWVTVKLSEYASDPAGMPGQCGAESMSKERIAFAAMIGGPYAPVNTPPPLVSTTRQGWMATNATPGLMSLMVV